MEDLYDDESFDERDDDLDDAVGELDDEVEDESAYGYVLATRDGEELIADRDEAVAKAKESTLDNLQSVTLEREDGRVRMQFRQGGLVDYVYETRKGRKA